MIGEVYCYRRPMLVHLALVQGCGVSHCKVDVAQYGCAVVGGEPVSRHPILDLFFLYVAVVHTLHAMGSVMAKVRNFLYLAPPLLWSLLLKLKV